jgi:hypothetical protein
MIKLKTVKYVNTQGLSEVSVHDLCRDVRRLNREVGFVAAVDPSSSVVLVRR